MQNLSTEPRDGRGTGLTARGLWSDAMGRLGIRAAQLLLIGLIAGLLIFAMLSLTIVMIPVLVAIILACALWPLVRLGRRVMSRMLTAWTVFLGSLLVLGGVATGLTFSVMNEWETLAGQAAEGFDQLRSTVEGLASDLGFTIDQSMIDGALDGITSFLASAEFGTGALSTINAAGSFVTGLALLLVTLFFFLKDGDRIWAFCVSWSPKHVREQCIRSGDGVQKTFGGYVRGTAIVAAADAVGITAALLILQVPLALPLGVVVFLGGFIPIVGATVAGALATLVALVANGPVVALIVLAAVILVQQLESNLLQPVVMAQTLKLHPLIILLALTVGTVLGGVVGAVLSVPLTAAAWGVVKVWTGRDQTPAGQETDEAQDEIDRLHREGEADHGQGQEARHQAGHQAEDGDAGQDDAGQDDAGSGVGADTDSQASGTQGASGRSSTA